MRCLFCFALILVLCDQILAVEVTFEEAHAAYRQNMQALKVFSCRIEREVVMIDDYFDVLEQRIARYERALPSFPPGKDRELVESEIARWKAFLATRAINPVHREAGMLIGLRSIQIAVPSSGPVPKLPVTDQGDLTDECLNAVVLCWSPDQAPNSWMWQGTGGQQDGVLYAAISSQRPQHMLDFPVLPVGSPDRMPFERNRLSPFDAFFQESFAETRVIGSDQVDGQPVVVVERKKGAPNSGMTVRASLSINHNFFPVHIIWNSGTIYHVKGFHETPDGAFYPSRWIIEDDGADDRKAAVRNSAKPSSVRYPRSIETWIVEDFQSDLQEPRLFSEIGFPEGTYCFDEDHRVYFTVGKPEKVVDAVLDRSQPEPADKRRNPENELPGRQAESINWLFWLNLVAVVGILMAFAVRYIRKRPEK